MITEEKRKVIELFAAGRKQYKLGEFAEAHKIFMSALEIDPNDGPSKVYAARAKYYVEVPPPDDWDGVFVMKDK